MANQLTVTGHAMQTCEFSIDDLHHMDAEQQVEDVSQLGFRRSGRAVRLDSLLRAAETDPNANRLKLISSTDNFTADVPLAEAAKTALVIYTVEGKPLDKDAGGPFRFWIPNHTACGESELDACANVKSLDRVEAYRH